MSKMGRTGKTGKPHSYSLFPSSPLSLFRRSSFPFFHLFPFPSSVAPPFPIFLILGLFGFAAHAADAAESVQERRIVYLLIRDLADKKLTVRVEAERKLKLLGARAAGDLILALENKHLAVTTMPAEKNEVARARAARVLGVIGGKRPALHLMKALGAKNALVKHAVIGALGDLRHKPAVPDLIKLSADADVAIAADAVRALGNIGDRSALKTLLGVLTSPGALKKKYKHDADVSLVRSAAAFALGMLGDTAAVPELLKALRDPDRRVRQHADLALRQMSGRNVRFKANAPETERERAAKIWDAWWEAKLKK